MENREALVQRLMQNFYRLARCRHGMFQGVLEEYGVTLHQFHLLLHIKSSGKVNVNELSEKMLVSMPTASRMINSLCEMELVSKKKASADRRSTYLELTGKGEKVVADIRKQQMEMITKVIELMPEEDMETFVKVMESIAEQWMAIMKEQVSENKELSGKTVS